MTPITTVDGIRNLRSGDHVGYYSSAFCVKEVAVAEVVVEPSRVVLKPTKSCEEFVLQRVNSSGALTDDISIEMTPKKWTELGLSGNYEDVSKRNPNPDEIIYILTEDEVMGHVVLPNI